MISYVDEIHKKGRAQSEGTLDQKPRSIYGPKTASCLLRLTKQYCSDKIKEDGMG